MLSKFISRKTNKRAAKVTGRTTLNTDMLIISGDVTQFLVKIWFLYQKFPKSEVIITGLFKANYCSPAGRVPDSTDHGDYIRMATLNGFHCIYITE